MTPAQTILTRLHVLGVQAGLHNGRLRFQPATAIDADLKAAIQAHKTDLAALLAAEARAATDTAAVSPDLTTLCQTCHQFRRTAWSTLCAPCAISAEFVRQREATVGGQP